MLINTHLAIAWFCLHDCRLADSVKTECVLFPCWEIGVNMWYVVSLWVLGILLSQLGIVSTGPNSHQHSEMKAQYVLVSGDIETNRLLVSCVLGAKF